MKKKILIIGAGIHGSFIANYFAKKKNQIYLIEKENDICLGSSSATHNRANRGFHYPRSKQTANECLKAYSYFEDNYGQFLKKIKSYYCIEKKSKVSFSSYIDFFKKNNLKYKIVKKVNCIKDNHLQGIVQAEEGCYDHLKLKNYLKKKIRNKKIKTFFNFELIKVKKDNKTLTLFSKNKRNIKLDVDLIINATYDNADQIIKIFKKNFKKIDYTHQLTEVSVVESKKFIPGITIMDGPFVTIMPMIGKKNKYLLYDVEHSILKKSKKPISMLKKKTNYTKMLKKLSRYINDKYKFKYIDSNYGNRPIPANDLGANRSTKILKINYDGIKLINILEGKYISAPYVAKKLLNEIK